MIKRAVKIGDIGASAPDKWDAPFDKLDQTHIIASIYGDGSVTLDKVQAMVKQAGDGKAFTLLGIRGGQCLGEGKGPFRLQ
ncbi:MAG: hypothetical protein GDA40_05465 [Rhodobacteraceae bacterium]|nr:hypothetical protein [Paracoccaceae bacterium]